MLEKWCNSVSVHLTSPRAALSVAAVVYKAIYFQNVFHLLINVFNYNCFCCCLPRESMCCSKYPTHRSKKTKQKTPQKQQQKSFYKQTGKIRFPEAWHMPGSLQHPCQPNSSILLTHEGEDAVHLPLIQKSGLTLIGTIV